jgi:squalene synthase HpnC
MATMAMTTRGREPVGEDIRTGAEDILRRIAERTAAQMSAENFPVALRLLPRGPRDALARVYGFARFVDDVGDEAPGTADDRLALLDIVAAEIHRQWSGASSSLRPVHDLGPLIRSVAMPAQPFLDLVEANRMDQHVAQYETFGDLIGYCALSANPVGRVVLRIANADDDANLAASDSVCTALQVLEHCQDVGEDAGNGRVYLPQEDLAAAGVPASDLTASSTTPALRRVVAMQIDRSETLLAAGPGLVRRLRGWARIAVAGYVAGGEATIAALRAAEFDVLPRTVRPSKLRMTTQAVRLLAPRAMSARARSGGVRAPGARSDSTTRPSGGEESR